jgi:hypothetical protein
MLGPSLYHRATDQKQLKRSLSDLVSAPLAKHGFNLKAAKDRFVRQHDSEKIGCGEHNLYFPVPQPLRLSSSPFAIRRDQNHGQ